MSCNYLSSAKQGGGRGRYVGVRGRFPAQPYLATHRLEQSSNPVPRASILVVGTGIDEYCRRRGG